MPDAHSLQPGLRFANGRFVLTRSLGRGGMGEVWLAQDERLQEPVALKFLPPQIRGDAAALDDLRRETARSHKLTHPNIVRIHDLQEEPDGMAFIVMEYVDGPTLLALRLEHPTRALPWETLRPLVEQLCAALDYAHGEKVIHRDLKPANMMVDSRGHLKLADFGIAAMASDSMSRVSARHSTSGTLPYMSPQQVTGKRPQAADDIYALGATLYELLTSKPPFYHGDVTHQVLHEVPEPMGDRLAALGVQNEIPPDVASLVMACLAKEPGQRPPSARAVAEWIGLEIERKLSTEALAETILRPAESEPTEPPSEPAQTQDSSDADGSDLGLIFAGMIFGVIVTLVMVVVALGYRDSESRKPPPTKMEEQSPKSDAAITPVVKPTQITVTTRPQDTAVAVGGTVTLQVSATGAEPLSYQWLKDGEPLPSATEFRLALSGASNGGAGLSDAGKYGVIITGQNGAKAYASALVTVNPAAPPTNQLSNSRTAVPWAGRPWINSLGMRFVRVPGTTVWFSIWDTRLQDFGVFVKETGYDATQGMVSLKWDGWKARGDTWQGPGFGQAPIHPVVGVSWEDAHAFCGWLTEKERGKGLLSKNQSYRLATDAEWSVAVGSDRYPWGNQWPPPPGAGNYAGSEAAERDWPRNLGTIHGYRDDFARTSPVGIFAANRYGLFDMGGNVWQWCEDWYQKEMNSEEIRQKSPAVNDDGGGQKFRVSRGASWNDSVPVDMLSAYRNRGVPGYRSNGTGFRCVLAGGGAR